jgi:hypothetical protein
MFIFSLPYHKNRKVIYFVNLSGLIELRIWNTRITRYIKNTNYITKVISNNRLIKHLRRKLNDNTIYKIIPYDNIYNNMSYLILRHPLQDFGAFEQIYKQIYEQYLYKYGPNNCENDYINYTDRIEFLNKNIELFNDLCFVYKVLDYDVKIYQYIPDRFKCNKQILVNVIKHRNYELIPDKVKNNRKLAIFMVTVKTNYFHACMIYQYLPYKFRKDPEIVSLALTNMNQGAVSECIIDHIPDNLINDRNFVLSLTINTVSPEKFYHINDLNWKGLNINIAPDIYRYLSIVLQRDYDILIRFGYYFIADKVIYNRIMTHEMKFDIGLHKKLIELNLKIYNLMPEELRKKLRYMCNTCS